MHWNKKGQLMLKYRYLKYRCIEKKVFLWKRLRLDDLIFTRLLGVFFRIYFPQDFIFSDILSKNSRKLGLLYQNFYFQVFFRNKQRFYRYNLDLHVEYLYVETRYTRNILQEKNIKRTSGYPHSFVFIKRCTAVSVDECKQNSALACIHSSQNLEYISYVNKVMGWIVQLYIV